MYFKIANSTLIAIIFIIFIILTLSILNKNIREKFLIYDTPKNDYKNVPEFIKDYQIEADMTVKDPNYRYENITQYNFDRLFAKVVMINK